MLGSALLDKRPQKQHLWAIFHLVINQRQFLKYGMRHVLNYYCKCICLRKTSSLGCKSSLKRDHYLNKGIDKLQKDLDVVKFLQLVRDFRVIKRVLFSQD